jgi:hypothetical protein
MPKKSSESPLRLFRVELSGCAYVVAADAPQAEKLALAALHSGEDIEMDTFSRLVHAKFPVDPDWLEGIPFGEADPADPDRTVGSWISQLKSAEAAPDEDRSGGEQSTP